MPANRLYFAYGPNLNAADLDQWLGAAGATNPLSLPVGPALLPDHCYAFRRYSAARGGGVLDAVPRRGHAIAGMLFEIEGDGWQTLDRREGAPSEYAKVGVGVVLADGSCIRANAYRLAAASDDARPHVPPDPAYVRIVSDGLRRHGLDGAGALEAAAHGEVPPSIVPRVFVYGTLLRGESRAPALEGPGAPTAVVTGTTRGALFTQDGEDYPALRIAPTDGGRVHGELLESDDVERLLARIDPIEDFHGHGHEGNLYERTVVHVDAQFDDGAHRVRAWTYVLADAEARGKRIASGDWRRR